MRIPWRPALPSDTQSTDQLLAMEYQERGRTGPLSHTATSDPRDPNLRSCRIECIPEANAYALVDMFTRNHESVTIDREQTVGCHRRELSVVIRILGTPIDYKRWLAAGRSAHDKRISLDHECLNATGSARRTAAGRPSMIR
jgi:hypothetical protein